jgi:hypothetical protein
MRLAYGDFTYFIKKEDHPYRAFFRRYVARLLYLDTSWGGCSGFVDCILGHHHILISSRTYCVDSSAFRHSTIACPQ